MKKFTLALVCALALMLCTVGLMWAFASEENTVYVSTSGNDTQNGQSAATAVKTMARAFELLPEGGKIVLTGTSYSLGDNFTTPVSEHKYTLTSEMKDSKGNQGIAKFSGMISINSDFVIENIRFGGPSTAIFLCNGHNVTFGKNIKNDTNSYIVGGTNLVAGDDPSKGAFSEDYTIEINSGVWVNFFGGNRRATGSSPNTTITADINIIVDGATFKKTGSAADENHNNLSGMNSVTGDLSLTVKSGTFYGSIYALGRLGTGGKLSETKGNISIRLLGGTFKNDSGNSAGEGVLDVCQDGSAKYIGNYHLEIGNDAKISLKSITTTGLSGEATLDVPASVISKCSGFIRDVYVSTSGKDTNGGTSPSDAYKTLKKAVSEISQCGGKVIVCGNTTVSSDTVLAASKKNLKITSVNNEEDYRSTATLTISGSVQMGADTTFDKINLAGTGALYAGGNELILGADVKCTGELSVSASSASGDTSSGGQAILMGGSYNIASAGSINGKGAASVSNTLVSVEGAEVKILCAAGSNDISGTSTASIVSGKVTVGVYGVYATGESKVSGTAAVEISGGKIGTEVLAVSSGVSNTAPGTYALSVFGGDISAVTKISGKGFSSSTGKAPDEILSKLEGFTSTVRETVIYVKDNGAGTLDGSSPENAIATLDGAIKLLGGEEGTIVICGPLNIGDFKEPEHASRIKICSRYAGIDYRRLASAAIIMKSKNNYNCSGDTYFDDVTISNDGGTSIFFGNGHNISFGEGVSCIIDGDVGSSYPYIFGGSNDIYFTPKSAYVSVAGGTWARIVGGNRYNGSYFTGDITVKVSGGNIIGYVAGSGHGSVTGNIRIEISGGVIRHGVFGIYCDSSNNTKVKGDIDIYLNAGTIKGKVNASRADLYCRFDGNYTVNMNGSNLDGVTDINGAAAINGTSNSKKNYGPGVSYSASVEGTIEAENPICSGADPWVIFHDGFYYMALVRGDSIVVSKAATVAELGEAEGVKVWTPSASSGLAADLWSPELHYFSEKEFGAEYAGWYIYIATIPANSDPDAQSNTRRCYAIKAVTDDPQGSYMAPDTKQIGHATKIKLDKNDSLWAIGPSIFRINGKVYLSWTGSEKTSTKVRQNLNLAEMKNPWTVDLDTAGVFCWPTESWEKYGATYSGEKMSPEVVEGATAVYGPDGSVYCIYSVSGYWTDHYALAQLKYIGGNPANTSSWEKSSSPIFVQNNIDVFGPGHAAFVQSADGLTNYFIYHGYKASGRVGGRYVHIEEYTVDKDGVHLGSGVAATKDKPIVVTKNPLPLSSKVDLFGQSAGIQNPNQKPAEDTATPDTEPTTGGEKQPIDTTTVIIIAAISVAVIVVGAAVAVVLMPKKKPAAKAEAKAEETAEEKKDGQ